MTAAEVARSLHAVAEAIADIPNGNLAQFPKAMLDGECAIGAAGLLCYLRDLFTAANKDSFSREEILVLLEITSRDDDIFPHGIATLMWDMEGPSA